MARLGSTKNPLILRVQSQDDAHTTLQYCNAYGWKALIQVDPNQPEDLYDLAVKANPETIQRAEPKVGRNDPCLCGSQKKYKKCCFLLENP